MSARGADSSSLACPPHYRRVRAVLDALDAPVVQLWGWAGTGKRGILRSLLEDEPNAEYLPAAWLAEPDDLEGRLDRLVGQQAALLVCEAVGNADAVGQVADLLRPGQRLIFAGERRIELGRSSLATSPDHLLLRADEVRALWRAAGAGSIDVASADRLVERSGGWLLPLSVWARDDAASAAAADPDHERLTRPLEGFLRERVLAGLAPAELEILVVLAARGPVEWNELAAAGDGVRWVPLLRAMIDRVGLPRLERDRLLLPPPLQAFLAAEARRQRDVDPVARTRRAATGTSRPDATTTGPATRSLASPRITFDERDDGRHDSTPDVRVALLGVPQVERRDPTGKLVPVVWSFNRPLRILAYLASAPDLQATREEIVSILWPEATDDAIRRNLHPAVSWLRRSVWPGAGRGDAAGGVRTEAAPSRQGSVVLLRDGVYSLDPSLRWQVDVRVFLERVEDGASHLARGRVAEAEASWEVAWRLYRGGFLEGWSDRWAVAQREELQLRFIELLRRLGELKARQGRLAEAEDAYRTLLLEDPLEEGVHVSIMRIYAARGRLDLVNRQFQRLRTVLATELGVEPSAPTLATFNDLILEGRAGVRT